MKSNFRKNSKEHYKEDVLKCIYKIHFEEGVEVDKEAISDKLKLRIAKVEEAIEYLTSRDYVVVVEGESNLYFNLTNAGIERAKTLIARHRLYETYLAEHTGYSSSDWHRRAETAEHVMTEEEFEELYKMLGHPLFDPHGAPIKIDEGAKSFEGSYTLDRIPTEGVYQVINVEDEPSERYQAIQDMGINVGAMVEVIGIDSSQISLKVHGDTYVMDHTTAESLTVVDASHLLGQELIGQEIFRLTSLKKGETAEVVGISDAYRGAGRRRLLDLGFVKGSDVSIDLVSPMKNPIAYMIRGTSIALRYDQAKYILIHNIKSIYDEA